MRKGTSSIQGARIARIARTARMASKIFIYSCISKVGTDLPC